MSTVIEEKERLTKAAVVRRLRDWERRVETLFHQIEAWAEEAWGKESIVWDEREQSEEYLMRQFGIPPRRLPVLRVLAPGHPLLFLPSCLWIIGANGMVDLIAGQRVYTIVDRGGRDGEPSDWHISNPDPRIVGEPFTRGVLHRIAGAKKARSLTRK